MYYLGIDTATPYLAMALWSPDTTEVASISERVERAHAARLFGALEQLLRQHDIGPKALAGIGVGVGPGSYTGLRVGIASAQGLARGLGLPLIGESTLSAIAYGQLPVGARAIVTLDAHRGRVYAGLFERLETGVRALSEPGKYLLAELTATFGALPVVSGPPDAGYLAQRAAEGGGTLAAHYL